MRLTTVRNGRRDDYAIGLTTRMTPARNAGEQFAGTSIRMLARPD